jgi:lysophospholipase L1-like esterase
MGVVVRNGRRLVRWWLPIALVTMGGWFVASSAAANAPAPRPASVAPITAGSQYLALGDSVTFGYMESSVVPAPNYKDPASFLGYPEQLAAELHLIVANAACPGETSASLINPSAQSNGCENIPGNPKVGYRRLYPLHVHYKGSQLAYALHYLRAHHNVRLVSLMIGANDGFLCQETTKDHCTSSAEVRALVAKISRNVHRILEAIRGTAHYRGQLAIVNYYALSPATKYESVVINLTVDRAAKPFHAVVADGLGAFQRASKHSGGNPCTAGLLTQLGSPGKCGIHPSYAGQALLAQALERVIRLG